MEPERSSCPAVVDGYQLRLEDMMKNRFAVSLIAASLLASGGSLCSIDHRDRRRKRRRGGRLGGRPPSARLSVAPWVRRSAPALEIPNAVITLDSGRARAGR
jgi:hypothetical protein